MLVCAASVSVTELPEETPLPRSDVEVTPVPLEMVGVAIEEDTARVELADDGKLRTCPTCRSVDTTPRLASSSCCVLSSSAVAIALVVESACLGFRRIEVYLQTGFANAGNGPEIKEAPTARI